MNRDTPFTETHFDTVAKSKVVDAFNEITKLGDALLNKDVENLTSALSKKHGFELLTIDFENVTKSIIDMNLSGKYFPNMFDVNRNRSYPVQAAKYIVPYTGGTNLIHVKHTYPSLPAYSITYDKKNIEIIVASYGKLEGNDGEVKKVKHAFEITQGQIEQMQKNLNEKASGFNEAFPDGIRSFIEKEIATIKRRKDSEDKL